MLLKKINNPGLFLIIVLISFLILTITGCGLFRVYYALNINIEGEGTVEKDPLPDEDKQEYRRNEVVKLRAEPAQYFQFSHWDKDNITNKEIEIKMDEAKSVTAVFTRIDLAITALESNNEQQATVYYNRPVVAEDNLSPSSYQVIVDEKSIDVQNVEIDENVVKLQLDLTDLAGLLVINNVEGHLVDYKDPVVTINPSHKQVIAAGDSLNFTVEARDSFDNLISADLKDFTFKNISAEGEFYQEESGLYEVATFYNGVSSLINEIEVIPAQPYQFSLDAPSKIKQGQELVISIYQLQDRYQNLISKALDLSFQLNEQEIVLIEDVMFTEGQFTDLVILKAAETSSLPAQNYQLNLHVKEAKKDSQLDIEQVLASFVIPAAAVYQREELVIYVQEALCLAKEPFSGNEVITIYRDQLTEVEEFLTTTVEIIDGQDTTGIILLDEKSSNILPQQVLMPAVIADVASSFQLEVLPKDLLTQEISFSSAYDEWEFVMIKEGKLRLVNWQEASVLQFPDQTYNQELSSSMKIDPQEKGISKEENDLIISFAEISLLDERIDKSLPLTFSVVDEEGNALSKVEVQTISD